MADADKKIDEEEDEVLELIHRISPILYGNEPGVQGAVLADLVARWLAGHFHEEGGEFSKKVRREILADFTKLVRGLLPFHVEAVNELKKRREN